MATQTLVLASINEGSLQARLELDIDDTSDPEDWDLVRGRVVNNLTRSVFFLFRRVNQQPWFSAEVSAGQTAAQAAGGPIRQQSDLPHMNLRT